MRSFIFNHFQKLTILFLCGSFSLLLLMIRIKITEEFFYLFLVWNLFLAAIPFIISLAVTSNKSLQTNKLFLFVFFIIWLLFLPNSFYVITDLVHLRHSPLNLLWFDSIMLFSFITTSLTAGYYSVIEFRKVFLRYFSTKKTSILIVFIFFMCGFGIYLGRFLRWNSWDIINNPKTLFTDIVIRVLNPIQYSETWFITLGFGVFITLYYFFFTNLNTKNVSI